ncbi:MAG: O-antigen polymerase [Bacteroidota bacterium]
MEQFSVILTDLIFILLHFFLVLFTYYRLGKIVMQPAVLFSLLWFIIILLHFIFKFTLLNKLEPLSLKVYIVFFVGVLFFSLGSIMVALALEPANRINIKIHSPSFNIDFKLRIVSTAVILVGLPFYIQAAYKIFLSSHIESFFIGLRYELSYGDADIGVLKYLMSLSYVVFAVNLYSFFKQRNKINRALLIISFLLTLTYAIFATGRTFLFMVLIIYLGISFLVNNRFSAKKIFFSLSIFFCLFMLFGIIMSKGGNVNKSVEENIDASSTYVGTYLVIGLNALDKELDQHKEGSAEGDYSTMFFKKVAMSLGLIPTRKINAPAHNYVFVPYATNVYTYYSPYISDFGKLYAWLMLAFYGGLHTWLYNKAVYKKSNRAMLYYTFLLFPLLLSFFDDLYLSIFSFWFQLIFFAELILMVNSLLNSNFYFRNQMVNAEGTG